MRVRKPLAGPVPEDGGREKNDEQRNRNQDNWVIEPEFIMPVWSKVEPEEESEKEKKEARKASKLPPVKIIARVKFENKRVIDLMGRPIVTVYAKQREHR
jgi:hypothetical protein